MPEEGTKQRLVSLQRPGVSTGEGSQFGSLDGRLVSEGVHFQIAPGVLDGIEFRGIGRQEEGVQVMKAGDEWKKRYLPNGRNRDMVPDTISPLTPFPPLLMDQPFSRSDMI